MRYKRHRRAPPCRSLTGARIETLHVRPHQPRRATWSLPHGSADRNITSDFGRERLSRVAPSRERGSKRLTQLDGTLPNLSLPHGSADRNNAAQPGYGSPRRSLTGPRNDPPRIASRSLTGARIETMQFVQPQLISVSLPHGNADRNAVLLERWTSSRVAPSRERGSKPKQRKDLIAGRSLPHGSADRNIQVQRRSLTGARIETRRNRTPACRSLTGARIETRCVGTHAPQLINRVAPSRERGSKRRPPMRRGGSSSSRSLTGARIETRHEAGDPCRRARRSLTGARIETSGVIASVAGDRCRSLTGARIETRRNRTVFAAPRRSLTGARIETSATVGSAVAPSRERGSKHARGHCHSAARSRSLPHGSADRNASYAASKICLVVVAPSRERGSKQHPSSTFRRSVSLPHGSADRNSRFAIVQPSIDAPVAPSRERGSKRCECLEVGRASRVAPSRERGSKPFDAGRRSLSRERGSKPEARCVARSLTGARIETVTLNGLEVRGKTTSSLPHGSADRNCFSSTNEAVRRVAPSRERGSKRPCVDGHEPWTVASLPHGSADRNGLLPAQITPSTRRSLTGARIETCRSSAPVAPSRERGSKLVRPQLLAGPSRSLTGARIETRPIGDLDSVATGARIPRRPAGRSLTGARIET